MKLRVGDIIWLLILAAVLAVFLAPQTRPLYEAINGEHPYAAGFVKYFILASMGELLAYRLSNGLWEKTKGFFMKAFVWGFIGVVITFMFKVFPYGIRAMIDNGYIPNAGGAMGGFLFALYTSIVANVAFGSVFMAFHRISDAKIEAIVDKRPMEITEVIRSIDWAEFIRFVVGKTIPYFWIPALTVTFLISENYRILFAAMLSIALGVILTFAKNKKQTAN